MPLVQRADICALQWGVPAHLCGHAELPQQRMSFFGRSVNMTLAKSPVLHCQHVSFGCQVVSC